MQTAGYNGTRTVYGESETDVGTPAEGKIIFDITSNSRWLLP